MAIIATSAAEVRRTQRAFHAVDHEIRYLTTFLVLMDVTAPENRPTLASKSCWLPPDLDSSYDEDASWSNDDSGGAA